jgi:hypothetical protein
MDLTERENEILIQSLRVNEKRCRRSVAQWMKDHTADIGTDEFNYRLSRHAIVLKEFVALRRRFGDDNPVKI